jgi:hypothetical protein
MAFALTSNRPPTFLLFQHYSIRSLFENMHHQNAYGNRLREAFCFFLLDELSHLHLQAAGILGSTLFAVRLLGRLSHVL